MSNSKRKPKPHLSGEIANLFRILKAMDCDESVRDADFRIAYRIAQARNSETGWAKISDALLVDELPRTDTKKLRKFRRRMEAANWIKTVEGERGRPTLYFFLEDNVAAIETANNQASEKRQAEFALKQIQEQTALKAAALGVRIDPVTGEVREPLGGKNSPLNKAGKTCPDKGSVEPPSLPQRSTSEDTLPREDVTQEAGTSEQCCHECGAPGWIRCSHTGEIRCQECDEDMFPLFRGELIQPAKKASTVDLRCVDCGDAGSIRDHGAIRCDECEDDSQPFPGAPVPSVEVKDNSAASTRDAYERVSRGS
ncbi:hypothetical protein [Methylobacterium iners]|uniref:Uncharacterized protein n=1 Tax=Methylobacterium iners TaxID=418707 RepID=A0ABQ4RTC0_9HYPH|nr:hypothetical protein [Methylobacterium iners]GJD92954.1 hypothetical protein OCOJLMKI_0138 [Methylobacterium iners]